MSIYDWTERRKELSVKYGLSADKENVYPGIHSEKSKSKNTVEEKKGLSARTENRSDNAACTILVRKSDTDDVQYQVYCDDENDRSRSRVRKNTKETIRSRTVEATEKVPKKILERKRSISAIKPVASQRIRSLSNNRAGASTGEYKLNNEPKHLTNDVKKRTSTSIQMWKDKMKKSRTGTVPKKLPDCHDVDRIKTHSVKRSVDSITYVTHRGSVVNDAINAGAFSARGDNQANNRLKDADKLNSNNITPRDAPSALPLTPTKVHYEKRGMTYKSSTKTKNHDDIDWILDEIGYSEDVIDAERKREENAPKLSVRFLTRGNMNAQQRKLIVEYFIRVGIKRDYTAFIIYQAVKLFDIAIDRILVKTDYLQLMAIGCLWIALKREAISYEIPSATMMLELAGDLYTGQEERLITYERNIICVLKFNIQFADPFSLLSYYVWNMKQDTRYNISPHRFIYFSGSYLLDLSMLDENLCNTSVFALAMAAADLSLNFISSNRINADETYYRFWENKNSHTEWEEREMSFVKRIMIQLVLESGKGDSPFNVVYKKYKRSKHGKVSELLLDKAKNFSSSNDILY